MIVLFVGGPRDGDRIQLTNEIIRSGTVTVQGEDKKLGPSDTVRYYIQTFQEGNGCNRRVVPIAMSDDAVKSPIQALIDGYRRPKQ